MYSNSTDPRISQGDILENFTYDLHVPISESEENIIKMTFPYVIVLSQDCDLLRDYEIRFTEKENKNPANKLFTVLICPLFNAEKLRLGEHLQMLKLECRKIDKDLWKPVKNNESPRYHFFRSNEDFGLPELVADFKYFYTFPIEAMYDLKKSHFKARITDLYRESISLRFSNYLARIALPDDF